MIVVLHRQPQCVVDPIAAVAFAAETVVAAVDAVAFARWLNRNYCRLVVEPRNVVAAVVAVAAAAHA